MSESELGSRICMLREKKGMLQKQLAQMMGLKGNSISNWENGVSHPSAAQITQLCGVLNVSADVLLGIDRGAAEKTLDTFEQSLVNTYRALPSDMAGCVRILAITWQNTHYRLAETEQFLAAAEQLLQSHNLQDEWAEEKAGIKFNGDAQ